MISANYIREMIDTFEKNPPNTHFQRGYLAALQELLRVAEANL